MNWTVEIDISYFDTYDMERFLHEYGFIKEISMRNWESNEFFFDGKRVEFETSILDEHRLNHLLQSYKFTVKEQKRLLDSNDSHIARCLALNWGLHESLYEQTASLGGKEAKDFIYKNYSLEDNLIKRLIESEDTEAKNAIARNSYIKSEHQRQLFDSGEPSILLGLASNQNLDKELASKLYSLNNKEINYRLANNVSVDLEKLYAETNTLT